MVSTETDDLTLFVEELHAAGQKALRSNSATDYSALESALNRFDSELRERRQLCDRDRIQPAMRALESGAPLDESARSAIREFIVGDALAYLEAENNLSDWQAELTRLLDLMLERANRGAATQMRALAGPLRDAVRLLPTMRAYFEDRERMAQFDRAMAKLDGPNRALLLSVLREKLSSATR